MARESLKASCRAIGYWIVVYVVVIHCFLVWHFTTPPAPEEDRQPHHRDTPANENDAESVDALLQDLKDRHELEMKDLSILIDELNDARSKGEHQLQQLQMAAYEGRAHREAMAALELPVIRKESATEVSLSNLELALSAESLAVVDSAEGVSQMLQLARDDLYQYQDRAAHVSWDHLTSVLRRPLSRIHETECAHDGATRRDLEERIDMLQEKIANRNSYPYPLLSGGKRAQFADRLRDVVQEWQREQSSALLDSGGDSLTKRTSESCLKQSSQVLPWIEMALEAVERKQDVREAILEALATDSIDTTSVTLDPVLHTEPTDATNDETSRRTLRDLLDRPLASQLARWLDQAPDTLGGYSDRLDRYFDSLPDQAGQAFVQRVLEAAGTINVAR